MLKIRLQRVGRKHEPTFRLVLTDAQNSTKSGRFKEILGFYDPRKVGEVLKVDRIKHWLSMGASPTDTVHNLLVNHKVIDAKKKNVLPKKTYTPAAVEEAPVEEAAPAAEAPAEESAPSEAPAEESPVEEAASEVAPEATAEAPTPAESEVGVPTESSEDVGNAKIEVPEPAPEEAPADNAEQQNA